MKKIISLVAAGVLALAIVAPVSAKTPAPAPAPIYNCATIAAYIATAPAPIAEYFTKVFANFC